MCATLVNIDDIVNEIENIMTEHAPIESIYVDVFYDMDIDIPTQPHMSQWKDQLNAFHMNYDDFINNTILAILSEICANVFDKIKRPFFGNTSSKMVRNRQRQIIDTQKKASTKDFDDTNSHDHNDNEDADLDVYKSYNYNNYFTDIKHKNLPPLFVDELILSLHSEIGPKKYEQTKSAPCPLYKLTKGNHIDFEHFSKKNLDEIVKYYKAICGYLYDEADDLYSKPIGSDLGEVSNFNRIIILYHLEIAIRFSSIFNILKKIGNKNLDSTQTEILHKARGICGVVADTPNGSRCKCQNIIFFGIQYYIDAFGKYCYEGTDDSFEKVQTLNCSIWYINKMIYAIRDTIIEKWKNEHSTDYAEFMSKTFNSLQEKFDRKNDNLSEREKKLILEAENLKNQYKSFESSQIKARHFVRMYVPNDKYKHLTELEKNKKENKIKQKKMY